MPAKQAQPWIDAIKKKCASYPDNAIGKIIHDLATSIELRNEMLPLYKIKI